MKLTSILALGAAAAAGFAVARTLLKQPEPPEKLPQPLRSRAAVAQTRLHRARNRVSEAMSAASSARHDAERELYEDYLRRTGRLEETRPATMLPDVRDRSK
jgi:hypothetical protein